MTQFVKEKFIFSGAYLYYEDRFIARFKYQAAACKTYATFLIKHFTVEEFFAIADAHEAAQRDGSAYKSGYGGGPYKVAEARGYLMPHIKKWLRDGGYEVNRSGYEKFHENQMRIINERLDRLAKVA